MTDDQRPPLSRAVEWAAWSASVLNALVGDYLRDRHNGLAIDMAFYQQGRPLALTGAALRRAHPRPAARLCVLLHGLGCTESIWTFRDPRRPGADTSYGALLQADLGYTPLYVRYNTGAPIADNGAALATLLDDLTASYPVGVEEIVLIGHSMGGLVLRGACHHGARSQSAWARRVSRVFYLGVPHDGAALARLGQLAADVLHAMPNPITRLIGDIFDLRSQGMKDLQIGGPLDPDAGAAVHWLAGAQHYLIGGALAPDLEHPAAALLGDGLVALPRAPTSAWPTNGNPPIPDEHIRVFAGINHLALAHDPAVYEQIRQWCMSV